MERLELASSAKVPPKLSVLLMLAASPTSDRVPGALIAAPALKDEVPESVRVFPLRFTLAAPSFHVPLKVSLVFSLTAAPPERPTVEAVRLEPAFSASVPPAKSISLPARAALN